MSGKEQLVKILVEKLKRLETCRLVEQKQKKQEKITPAALHAQR